MPIQVKIPLPAIPPVKTWEWMRQLTQSKIEQLRIDLEIEEHLLKYFEFQIREDKKD